MLSSPSALPSEGQSHYVEHTMSSAMDKQVLLFGSFSEDEAIHFQLPSESSNGQICPSVSSPYFHQSTKQPSRAAPAVKIGPVTATGNGNSRCSDSGTSLASLGISKGSLVFGKVDANEHESVDFGNGGVNTTKELDSEHTVLRGDSGASTPRKPDTAVSAGEIYCVGSIPVSPSSKTWASLLDMDSEGGDLKGTMRVASKDTEATHLPKLSGESWQHSLKEVEVMGKRLQPRGLINKGNTCFLNATLQALLSCSHFVHLLHTTQARGVPEVGYPTLRACVDFFKEFEFEQRIDGKARTHLDFGKPFVPLMFDSVLHKFNPNQPSIGAGRSRQEDAQEFLSFMMDCLHDELLRLEGVKQRSTVAGNGMIVMADEEDDWETVGPKNRTAVVRTHAILRSALTDIFGGELYSLVKSKGSKASATVEPFLVLHLDILPEAVRSVEDALKLFAAPETLEGYKTAVGKAAVASASKSVKLQSLPPLLVLHVKRFSYGAQGSSKLHKSLHFPLNLSIGRDLMATTVSSGSDSRNYELVATVTHHGNDHSRGHYTAHSKQQDGRWLRFDDGVVSVVGVSRVLQDLAYILFYKRVCRYVRNS